MKKILATAAVLAFAGAASAGSFTVNGAVDFGGGNVPGGIGAALEWDGNANISPAGGQWFTFLGNFSGFRLATPGDGGVETAFAGGSVFTATQFSGAAFSSSGASIPSGTIEIDGQSFQAVQLAHFDSGLSNFRLADNGFASIQIEGVLRDLAIDADAGSGFSLTFAPNPATGGTFMYVISGVIPTPGAAGLLGLAGLAAVRRRR